MSNQFHVIPPLKFCGLRIRNDFLVWFGIAAVGPYVKGMKYVQVGPLIKV